MKAFVFGAIVAAVALSAQATVQGCTPAQRATAAGDLQTAIQGTNVVCGLAESQPADATLADVVCAIAQAGEQTALVIVDALGTDSGAPAAAVMSVKMRLPRAQALALLARHPGVLTPVVDAAPAADVSVDAARAVMDAIASP